MARRRRRPRLRIPETLEGVIERAGENRFAPRRPPIAPAVWAQAVGLRVAERAKPIALEGRTLIVKVATSVWANELSLLAMSILDRLRAVGVEADDMRFRVGSIDPPARPAERRVSRAVPPPAPLPRDIVTDLARIEDPELREAVALAASANLAWQSHVRPPRKK